ncbi:MAG: 50S ribosomal protein L4 [Deltaproteobacteria bacterium]|nr:50S ribosomal protein L4 [Deltaproteobacteria bacterium]
MPTLDLFNQAKEKVGTVSLRDDVFGVKVNFPLVHQVLNAQRANQRQGTAKTKRKAEVRGGGRKPFRQKGTGNARQGSTRSPLQPGGGQTFGPIPRSYRQKTPKLMIRGALRSVLSDRVFSQRLLVIDEFKLESAKTKSFYELFKNKFQLDKALIIDEENKNLALASRNIPRVKFLRTENLNVYDLVKYPWLLLTKQAVSTIENRLSQKEALQKEELKE